MEVIAEIRYLKKNLIGKGNFGEVWEAFDLNSSGIIAVKEIPRSALRKQNVLDLFAEAKAMEAVGVQKNVVPIRIACSCSSDDKIAIIMPFYQKGTLQKRIAEGPLSLHETIRVTMALLSGLHHIHLAGYIHYDIKPSNILFSNSDAPMISDFGQARMIGPTGVSRFPPLYPDGPPPEYYTGIEGSTATDIYLSGLTLYRCVNGDPFYKKQVPVDDSQLRTRTLDGTFPKRDDFLPHIPNALRQVIRKALSVKPSERFASATDLQDAVASVNVELDWQVKMHIDDSITWKAVRLDKTALIVELISDGDKWSIQQFYEKNGKQTRRNVSDWESKITRKQADDSLKRLFRSL